MKDEDQPLEPIKLPTFGASLNKSLSAKKKESERKRKKSSSSKAPDNQGSKKKRKKDNDHRNHPIEDDHSHEEPKKRKSGSIASTPQRIDSVARPADSVEKVVRLNEIISHPGSATTYLHPVAYSKEDKAREVAFNMYLSDSEVNKINVFSEDHPAFEKERTEEREKETRARTHSDEDDSNDDEPISGFVVPETKEDAIGNNLLETQHRLDHSFENQCMKEMSSGRYASAQAMVKKRLEEDRNVYKEYVKLSGVLIQTMCDLYGNKFNKLTEAAEYARSKSRPQNPVSDDGSATFNLRKDPLVEHLCMRELDSNRIPVLKRKDIVLDFLRPAVPECGERSCVGGDCCASILQYRQLVLKDSIPFKREWKLSLNKSTGLLEDSSKREFGGFPLREFLCPITEKKRKRDFSLAMSQFLNDSNYAASSARSSHPSGSSHSSVAEYHNWLAKTTDAINPPLRGHCILCLFRLRSEATTLFSSGSVISNPSVCVVVQHHTNIFGQPGEYKPGCEINRGASVCGLAGTVLEYRVDNYLPGSAELHYSCLERYDADDLNSNGGYDDYDDDESDGEDRGYLRKMGASMSNRVRGGGYKIANKRLTVLQWVESEDIVCKSTDVLQAPKNSMIYVPP
jgi:hypothetical protein